MKNSNTVTLFLLLLLLLLMLTVVVTAKTTVPEHISHKKHERATMRHGSSTATGEAKFEIEGYTKVCWTPGPCFKKKLVCPKKCSKLPGEGGAGGDRRLVKNHFPGQCVFNCKKCIAHC